MKRILFYILSFTWGIIYSLLGLLVTLILLICLKKPKMFGYCWYFQFGNNWGGVNFGPCFVVDLQSGISTKQHEHGHAIQNAILGPIFPLIIAIPSCIRCLYITLYFAGNSAVFEAILVCLITFITFTVSSMIVEMNILWLYYILAVCIYLCIVTFWIVYIEGVKYRNNQCPLYDDIWFEGWASNICKNFCK